MKRSRFSEEQIIAVLREQETGAKTADVCRKHGVSEAMFYKWKAKWLYLRLDENRGSGHSGSTSAGMRTGAQVTSLGGHFTIT